jgi:hypothetical protein
MKRAFLRVESLDGRILPSVSSVGIGFGHPGVAVIDEGGSKPGATGEGIQVFGSKPTASGGIGLNATDGIGLFGGSKLGISAGGG